MKIAMVGPICTQDIRHLLDGPADHLPAGYAGAPLLVTLIEELIDRGHQVVAISTSPGMKESSGEVAMAGGRSLDLAFVPLRRHAWRPNGWRPGRILDLFAFERGCITKAIRRAKPDVVHAHWSYEFALAAQASGFPTVVTCHDSPLAVARLFAHNKPSESLYRWLRVLMAVRALRNALWVTAVSPYMQQQIAGFCSASVRVIPNPLPRSLRSIRHVSSGGVTRLAMICNGWSKHKNPQAALEAYRRICEQLPEVEMHLYGIDFGREGMAADWWRAHGSAGAPHFHGPLPYSQLLRELARCDVLIHPALEEAFGMAPAEAMALGAVVIGGRDSGAVPWVVGSGGVLVNVRNPGDIARTVMELARDRARFELLAKKAHASAWERFDPATVVQQYEATYAAALAGRA